MELVFRRLLDRRGHHDAGVVDQDRWRAEQFLAGIDRGFPLLPQADVEVHVRRVRGTQVAGERLPRLVEDVCDQHTGALANQQLSDGAADAAAAARDNRDLSCHSSTPAPRDREGWDRSVHDFVHDFGPFRR